MSDVAASDGVIDDAACDDVTSCDATALAALFAFVAADDAAAAAADDDDDECAEAGASAENEPERVRRSNSIELVRARFTRPVDASSWSSRFSSIALPLLD